MADIRVPERERRFPMVETVSIILAAIVVSVLVLMLPPRSPELAQTFLILVLSFLALRFAFLQQG
ncbi:MAG: hypothetical protein J5J00_13750 [Deltaproteobacteria bacterium]|nr:hypothetical protein [Deltaproteobacteria bacterium]